VFSEAGRRAEPPHKLIHLVSEGARRAKERSKPSHSDAMAHLSFSGSFLGGGFSFSFIVG